MPRGVPRPLAMPVVAIAMACACMLLALLGAGPARADTGGIDFTATLAGRSISAISSNDPLVLHPGTPLVVDLRITNNGNAPQKISAARIAGKVMGLSFFSYDTQLGLTVPAGRTVHSRFSVGLTDLGGQADGLLPTDLSLLNGNADEIATKSFAVDVKGHLTSIYGLFGLAVIAITALWLLSLIYRVARRALPANRWSRAVQFSAAGFGVGLTLTFSVSALRLLTPSAGVWAPFVFGAGFVGLLIGYLTPGPRVEDDDDEDFIAARAPQPAFAGAGAGAGQLPRHEHARLGAPRPDSLIPFEDHEPQHVAAPAPPAALQGGGATDESQRPTVEHDTSGWRAGESESPPGGQHPEQPDSR